jgi:hypothetical protein
MAAHPMAVLRCARVRGWFEGIAARREGKFTWQNPYAAMDSTETIGHFGGWYRGYTAEALRVYVAA